MFLKNKNINFKNRRSKVTDYAALNELNKFNNTGGRKVEYIYHRTVNLL